MSFAGLVKGTMCVGYRLTFFLKKAHFFIYQCISTDGTSDAKLYVVNRANPAFVVHVTNGLNDFMHSCELINTMDTKY